MFVVSDLVVKEIEQKPGEIMAFLTSRRLAKKTDILLISFEKANLDKDYLQMTVEQIVERYPKSFAGQMDMALKNICLMSKFPGFEVKIEDLRTAPCFYVTNEPYEALNFMLKSLWKEELVEVNYFSSKYFPCGVTVTAKGWKRLNELQETAVDDKTLFSCCTANESAVSGAFAKALKKVSAECGFSIVQNAADKAEKKISNELIASIKTSEAIVCDFTGLSGDTYYTAALARGLGKLCVLTCHESAKDKLQIDAGQLSVIFWDKQETLQIELLNALKAGM